MPFSPHLPHSPTLRVGLPSSFPGPAPPSGASELSSGWGPGLSSRAQAPSWGQLPTLATSILGCTHVRYHWPHLVLLQAPWTRCLPKGCSGASPSNGTAHSWPHHLPATHEMGWYLHPPPQRPEPNQLGPRSNRNQPTPPALTWQGLCLPIWVGSSRPVALNEINRECLGGPGHGHRAAPGSVRDPPLSPCRNALCRLCLVGKVWEAQGPGAISVDRPGWGEPLSPPGLGHRGWVASGSGPHRPLLPPLAPLPSVDHRSPLPPCHGAACVLSLLPMGSTLSPSTHASPALEGTNGVQSGRCPPAAP